MLNKIKDRYLNYPNKFPLGIVNHHWDCDIYRSLEVHDHATCGCGLLHDLNILRFSLASKVYPLFEADMKRQELGKKFYDLKFRRQHEDDLELVELGFKSYCDLDHIPEHHADPDLDEREWKQIETCFGVELAESFKKNYERCNDLGIWNISL